MLTVDKSSIEISIRAGHAPFFSYITASFERNPLSMAKMRGIGNEKEKG